MGDIIKVANLNILKALPNHVDGEVAFCEEEEAYYIYQEGEWRYVEATMDEEHGLQLNLYALNKQVVSQLPSLSDDDLNNLATVLTSWRDTRVGNKFLMYGKEIGYFTLFEQDGDSDETFGEVVVDCLRSFDAVKDYEVSGEAIELWVETEGDVVVLYLFNYDAGVVTYHG
jgi:hypothetical protein